MERNRDGDSRNFMHEKLQIYRYFIIFLKHYEGIGNHAYICNRRQDQNRTGSKLVPLERGEIPSYDTLRRILSDLCKHVHFRRTLPIRQEVFPMKVDNKTPFDIYHNVMASPITLRDCGYLYIIIHTENSYMYLS